MARFLSGAVISGIVDGYLREQGMSLVEKHKRANGPRRRQPLFLAVMNELQVLQLSQELITLVFSNMPADPELFISKKNKRL